MLIKNNIRRLLIYRQCLKKLKELGFEVVYSYNLGHEAEASPEQVRKDFSKFGIKGKKKAGYKIDHLLEALDTIFKKDKDQNVILVGMGNIGKALSNYKGFATHKIVIRAAFDIDPSKQMKSFKIPVYPVEDIPGIVKKYNVKIAIIAVPKSAAQEVCSRLTSTGIRGIINFSPINLKHPKNVFVNNINLANELESLIYITQNQ
jgi:redox-sensing transcriptional repressor